MAPHSLGHAAGDTRCRPAEPVRQIYGIDLPGGGWKMMNIGLQIDGGYVTGLYIASNAAFMPSSTRSDDG